MTAKPIQSIQAPRSPNKGFTLIEMIIVIILLGLSAIFVSGFIRFGTQIYNDVTERDALISASRFAIERLNREVRSALPNSVRINQTIAALAVNNKQCLEFSPVVVSTVYLDIPVAPEDASDKVSVVKFDDDNYNSDLKVAVYTLTAEDVYSAGKNKVFALSEDVINKAQTPAWTVTLEGDQTFAFDSGTSRLYFIDSAISYCVENGQLTRYVDYTNDVDNNNTPKDGTSALMAENVNLETNEDLPFRLSNATRTRNAIVSIKMKFSRNDEDISFNNEIQVPNVP
jgi:MSHA biogenesis protein MshO